MVYIESGIDNSGHLWADGGNITVHGDVTGAGDATISGTATLEFDGSSAENTTVADGGDGKLRLDHSSSFTGAISGLNHGDSFDPGDVAFGNGTGTTISYSANGAEIFASELWLFRNLEADNDVQDGYSVCYSVLQICTYYV